MAKKYLARTALSVTLVALITPPSQADVFIKEKQHTDSFTIMGNTQPAVDQEVSYWIGANRMRSNGPDGGVLVLLDKNRIYLIDHKKKEYTEIPQDVFNTTAGSSTEELPAGMPGLMQDMMKMKVTVQQTGESGAVKKWQCRKYKQTIETGMGNTTSDLWATEEIKVAPELLVKFAAVYQSRTGQSKELIASMVNEMKKIKGFVVKSNTSAAMMGATIKSTTEAIEVQADASAPAGTYELSPKYKEAKWK
jgi:hypothetical protein